MAEQHSNNVDKLNATQEERIGFADERLVSDLRNPDYKTMLPLIRFAGADTLLIIVGFLCAMALGALPIVFFSEMGDLLGGIATADADGIRIVISQAGLRMTYIAIGALFAAFFAKSFLSIAAQRISVRLQGAFFNSITSQEIGFFDMYSSGSMIKSLSEDVSKITSILNNDLLTFAQYFGQALIGIILALVTRWQVALLGFTSIPIMLVCVSVGSFIMDLLSRRSTKQLAISVSTANEVIGSMKTVRSMAGEQKEMARYTEELGRVSRIGIISGIVSAISFSVIAFCVWAGVAIAIWYAGKLLGSGDMSVADLIKIWGFIVISVIGMHSLLDTLPTVAKAQSSGIALLNVILRDPAIKYKGGKQLSNIQGNIIFSNVTFRYPSRPKVAVLNNFSLDIKAGTSVALVGQSGSGKSTIVGLIEKWYEPEQGTIVIDGVDLKEIDPLWLHRHLGIVSQEPQLFANTIYKNITYVVDTINFNIRKQAEQDGKTEEEIAKMLVPYTEQDVYEAAQSANAHDFIVKLPDGYDTIIGERGVSLSGGQKQRVAIARSVLQNPSILLLDEATSALDTKSESLVQDALDKLMKSRTTIVVAHRLSTIQDCDVIVVMKQGVVVEMGTHDELIDKPNGYYNTLAQKQKNLGKSSSKDNLSSPISAQEPKTDDTISNIDTISTSSEVTEKKREEKSMVKFTNIEAVVDPHEPKVRSFLPIFLLMGPESIFILISCIGAAGFGASPILGQYIFGKITNAVTPSRNSDGSQIPFPPGYSVADQLAYYAIFIVVLGAGVALSQAINYFFSSLASERISLNIKRNYFNSIVSQEMGFFDIVRAGRLMSSMSEDVSLVQDGLTKRLSTVVQNLSQFVVGIIFAFVGAWQMSCVQFFVALGTIGTIFMGLHFFVLYFAKKRLRYAASAMISATEVIGAMRTIRSMGAEEREQKRYANDLWRLLGAGLGENMSIAVSMGGVFFCLWADTALTMWYGGNLVANGTLQAGALTQVTGNVTFAVLGLTGAMIEMSNVTKAIASAKEILRVTKRKPQIPLQGGKQPNGIVGDVEFKNVSFAYPSRPHVVVLKDFSLKINHGQHVALVGESGSGKSTITGLIERFYDPLSGTVTLDGVNLSEIDPEWLHKHVAIVTQEPQLFATTIRKNITYAVDDSKVSMEKVIEAAKAANAHDFITSLPDGYDTIIGERGVSMSGGQKQRVAIARAMLQNASLLLLDEATSALDTEAESLVQTALDRLMVNRTTIVIAHRLSTVKDCDLIIAMKQGEIVELGTHEELLEKRGMYFKLAEKQLSYGNANTVTITEND
jgi:ATP-binding cassette subfamily B (MDR/TAP) protein 1